MLTKSARLEKIREGMEDASFNCWPVGKQKDEEMEGEALGQEYASYRLKEVRTRNSKHAIPRLLGGWRVVVAGGRLVGNGLW